MAAAPRRLPMGGEGLESVAGALVRSANSRERTGGFPVS